MTNEEKNFWDEAIFVLDGRNGRYIPQQIWNTQKNNPFWDWSGVDLEDQRSVENGPDDPHYWVAWENILDNVVVNSVDGKEKFSPFQNSEGDVFLTKI